MTGPSGGGAKVAAAFSELSTLRSALDRFHPDCGRYPTLAEGFAALQHAPSGAVGKWNGPYLSRIPTDPWGNPYTYLPSGPNAFEVTSRGADGVPGGIG